MQSRLLLLGKNFNDDVSSACIALIPDASQIQANGRERAYAIHYQTWRGSHEPLFLRIALAIPRGDSGERELIFENLDLEKMQFVRAEWPADWSTMRDVLEARATSTRPLPRSESPSLRGSTLMEFPRFAESPDRPGFRPQEWLVVELNKQYIRDTMLPALLNKYLAESGGINYDTEVTLNSDTSKAVFGSGRQHIAASADASVELLQVQLRVPPVPEQRKPTMRGPRLGRRLGPGLGDRQPDGRQPGDGGRGREDGDRRFGRRDPPPEGFGPPGEPGGEFGRGREGRGPDRPDQGEHRPPRQFQGQLEGRGRGVPPPRLREKREPADGPPPDLRPSRELAQARWRLFVRNRAGSLETLTARARNRNILIAGGLLFLILATVALLLSVSRQSQRLAESHMNFVAGVSHELRTPLTVIRTAAYNLRGKLANRPDQVEKYGQLIQEESEKLGALVEQVLQFASGQAGHDIREREPVAVEALIEDSLAGDIEALEARGIQVEKRIDADLPPVLADRVAMKHALRNLIDNALKYGTESDGWIGISACAVGTTKGRGVEIRVADRGPGIPDEEQARVFDPFFRGRRAISDQVHGTGLGLNLARRIVEAHGGTIEVQSVAPHGTEFIVRIPAATHSMNTTGVTV